MPERVDAILKRLLVGRSLGIPCLRPRTGLTIVGARAAVDHLAAVVQVNRRHGRCPTCGGIDDTVSVEYGTT